MLNDIPYRVLSFGRILAIQLHDFRHLSLRQILFAKITESEIGAVLRLQSLQMGFWNCWHLGCTLRDIIGIYDYYWSLEERQNDD